MKKYVAFRNATGELEVVVQPLDGSAPAEDLVHVVLHSPDGFECGYSGSGPADLALSILADHFACAGPLERFLKRHRLGDEFPCREAKLAYAAHQAFKEAFVARDRDGFEINTWEIERFLAHWSRGAGDGMGGQQHKQAGARR